jgi:hypothetical protein
MMIPGMQKTKLLTKRMFDSAASSLNPAGVPGTTSLRLMGEQGELLLIMQEKNRVPSIATLRQMLRQNSSYKKLLLHKRKIWSLILHPQEQLPRMLLVEFAAL